MNKEDQFSRLPLELRSKIFSYIPFHNIENCLFVCRCFYTTYRYGPQSTDGVLFQLPRADCDFFYPNQIKFYLNIITDNCNKPLKRIEFVSASSFAHSSPTFSFITKLLKSYHIVNLILPRSNHILTSIELSGPFHAIKSLTFGFTTPLDFNRLQVLADLTPALQSLNINYFPCLSQRYYNGNKPFLHLRSLLISTSAKTLPQGHCSPAFLLSKFLTATPNLINISLLGDFFQKDFEVSLDFIELLSKLKYLAFEIPFTSTYTHSFPAITNGTQLTHLYIKADGDAFESSRIYQLNNVESVCFASRGCIQVLPFHTGDNLRKLVLNPDLSTSYKVEAIIEICLKCPNLEQLFVRWLNIPLDAVNIIASICIRLRKINFHSIKTASNSISLSKMSSIKDIYLCKMPSQTIVELFISNDFNLYDGEQTWEDLEEAISQGMMEA